MANKRIKDLTEKNVLASGDYFPIDNSTDGTKKVNSSKILDPISHVQGEVSGSGDSYSSSKSYAKGDLVIHDNVLYVCTSACTSGSWATNSSHFTATTLASEVTSVKQTLTQMNNINLGKETIIRIVNENGAWGLWASGKFDSTTTLQDILTYLKTNSIKADKVTFYTNANNSAFNQSLPDTGAAVAEIISPYGTAFGLWDRCYVRVIYFLNTKVYYSAIINNTVQAWKGVTMS